MGSMNHSKWKANANTRLTVGRDHHGWWVVHDRLGRVGGFFASEEAALHFALEVAGPRSQDVCLASGSENIELFEEHAGLNDYLPVKAQPSIGSRVVAHNRSFRGGRR